MNLIEKGEPFYPSTDEQDEGTKLVLKTVGKCKAVENRYLVQKLRKYYDQKKDRIDLLKNLSRSSNNPVVMMGEQMKSGQLRKVEKSEKKEVKIS